MKEIIKDNLIMIMTCAFMFLSGVGIGAAITDAINRWDGGNDNESNDRH